jgi:hypothetical protein
MITTPWDRIDASTLQAMCDAGAPESPTLDFKHIAPLKQRDDPGNEFAKDVCAFANADGGDLVYGIASRDDCAEALAPLTGETADACKRRLSEVIANHVEPRIANVRFKDVAIGDSGFALLVRVPRSFDAPHRFKVRPRDGMPAHHRFVARSDTGTQDMDYAQLRDAFGRTATLVEKARSFKAERLRLMTDEGQLLAGMARSPKFCVHLVPLAGIARGSSIDVRQVYHRHDISFARPGGYVPQKQTNLDGLLMAGPANRDTGQLEWLVRLFRSGAMEYLEQTTRQDRDEDGGEAFIPAVAATDAIRRTCVQLLSHARALGLEGPAILGLAGIDIGAHPFRIVMHNRGHYGNSLADRAHVVLGDQWIDELGEPGDLDGLLRPMLDEYWQCFGEVRCECYDETGKWHTTA